MFLQESWVLSKCCFKMSSWLLAIICRASKKLPVFVQDFAISTQGKALSTAEKDGFWSWSTFNNVPICDNILPLFVIYSVVHVLLWVFNRIKEGFGSDYRIGMVLHLLMSLCLFLKLVPVYERLVNKSTLVFPAMHRYHESAVFTEYSIYWRAVDHPEVLTEVSWLKPSSALMKKSRWKLVVNWWRKMTFNQVILLTNRQLICGRSKFLRGRRKLPDVIYVLLHHWF